MLTHRLFYWIGKHQVQQGKTINHILYSSSSSTHLNPTAPKVAGPDIYIKKQLTEQGLLAQCWFKFQTLSSPRRM